MKKTLLLLGLLMVNQKISAQVNTFYAQVGYLNSVYNDHSDQPFYSTIFTPIHGFTLAGGYMVGVDKRINILVDLNYALRGSTYEILHTTGITLGSPPQFITATSKATHTLHTLGLHAAVRLNILHKENHQIFLTTGLKPGFILADTHKEHADSELNVSEVIATRQETVLMDIPIKLGYTLNRNYELNLGYNFPLLNVHSYLGDNRNHYWEIGFTYYFTRKESE